MSVRIVQPQTSEAPCAASPPPRTLRFGATELDFARRELRRAGAPVALQPTPLRVLLYLAEHRDRIVPRNELLDAVWGGVVVGDEALTTALAEVRRGVEDQGGTQCVIRTHKGLGYRFVAESTLRADGALPFRSLAVLPLVNLSSDPEQEYFADGMTETLIGDLGKIRTLRVISRTSVMQFKGARKSIPEIAAQLGVDALLEGTVSRENERVRVAVQLVDGSHDHQLWSERYERRLRGIFTLQSDVARAVASRIARELSLRDGAQRGSGASV